mgnify:CR=1 FL=1
MSCFPTTILFLSPEQKYQVHDSFRQLIAQNRDGKIHALQISTESSIRAAQERSKQEVTGKLKDIACAKIDAQTEALISMIGGKSGGLPRFLSASSCLSMSRKSP